MTLIIKILKTFLIITLIVVTVGIISFTQVSSEKQNKILNFILPPIVRTWNQDLSFDTVCLDSKKRTINMDNIVFNIENVKIQIPNIKIEYDFWNKNFQLSFNQLFIDKEKFYIDFVLKGPNFWNATKQWDISISEQKNKCTASLYHDIIKIHECDFSYKDTNIGITGQLTKKGEDFSNIVLDTKFSNLPLNSYKLFAKFAKSNKIFKFFDNFIQDGNISGYVHANFDRMQKSEISEDNLSGKIHLSNGALIYDSDFPIVEGIDGDIVIKGGKITSEIFKANSFDIKSKSAKVDFVWRGPLKSVIDINVDITASPKDINYFLSKEDRAKLKDQGIDFASSIGQIQAKLDLLIPLNEKEQNYWKINGQIFNFKVSAAKEKIVLDKANIKFNLDKKNLVVEGVGNINGYSSTLKYTQNLPYSNCLLICDLDLSNSNNKNMMLQAMGNAILHIRYEDLNNKKNIVITSDLTKAKLILNQSSVETEIGQKLILDIRSSDNLNDILVKLNGSGPLSLSGNFNLGNNSFNNIALNSKNIKNFTGSIQFNDDKTILKGHAQTVDLSEYNLFSLNSSGNTKNTQLDLELKINTLALKKGLSMKNFSSFIQSDKNRILKGNIYANLSEQIVEAKLTNSNINEQSWTISTGDAGSLFKALGIYNKIDKGNMVLNISTKKPPANSQQNAPLIKGDLTIDHFSALKTPILTKIVSFTSIPGLVNLLNTEIKFQKLEATFNVLKGVLNILDCNIVGTSFDLMVKGAVNLETKKIVLKGAVVPSIYGLNSLVQSMPLINTVLNRKKLKGLIVAPFNIEDKY